MTKAGTAIATHVVRACLPLWQAVCAQSFLRVITLNPHNTPYKGKSTVTAVIWMWGLPKDTPLASGRTEQRGVLYPEEPMPVIGVPGPALFLTSKGRTWGPAWLHAKVQRRLNLKCKHSWDVETIFIEFLRAQVFLEKRKCKGRTALTYLFIFLKLYYFLDQYFYNSNS